MNLKANLTNDDIIKALKDWAEKVNHAVYFEVNENGAKELYENLLNAICLIDRLQTQNEALIAGQETLQKALAEKAAEVERLKNDCFCISNERDAIGDCLNEAVEEAIKEFAERLKTEQSFYDGQETRIYLTEKDLDNLVKEMVGDAE